MHTSVYDISLFNLFCSLTLVAAVFIIHLKWSLDYKTVLYAAARMILQLLAVGFLLVYIFEWKSPFSMTAVLLFMLLAAGWISTRPLRERRRLYFPAALLSLAAGGIFTLAVVVLFVIKLSPWYQPRYLIPLAGMIFANAMNSISLAADRFEYETKKQASYEEARNHAFRAALIPILNSFFAVGLVSLPGMMTGQILAGVSPLIAVRYQIVVMCMLLGGSGFSTAMYLKLLQKKAAA